MNSINDEEEKQRKLIEDVTQTLDEHVSSQTKVHEDSMVSMRMKALQYLPDSNSKMGFLTWDLNWRHYSGAGFALSMMLAFLYHLPNFTGEQVSGNDIALHGESIETLDLLVNADEFEMLEQEDVDFYLWLETETI